MKLTRGGIALNLNETPYIIQVIYNDNQILKFHFSSEIYKNKFFERTAEHSKKVNQSLSKRFGFDVDVEVLADLTLYKSIEKRGFLVINEEGEKFDCPERVRLDTLKVTLTRQRE